MDETTKLMDQLDPTRLYWSCMVCKESRLDEFITVTKVELNVEDRSLPYVFNFRHCIDRAPCVAMAQRAVAGELLISEEP